MKNLKNSRSSPLTTFLKHKYAARALKNDCALSIKDYIKKKFC